MKFDIGTLYDKLINELRKVDTQMMVYYLLLIICGLFIQLDITSASGTLHFFLKQFFLSLTAIFFCLLIFLFWKIKWFKWSFWIFYLFTLGLLIYVLHHGEDILGAMRVLRVNLIVTSISVQPSLLARLVLVILFARVLSSRENLIANSSVVPFVKNFFPLLLFTGIYYIQILKENHLSAVLTSGFTLISLLFLANIRKATIAILIIFGLILGSFVVVFQKDGKFTFPNMSTIARTEQTTAQSDDINDELATKQPEEKESFRIGRIESFIESSLIIRWITGNKTNNGMDRNNRESIICLTTGKVIGCGANGGMGKLKYLPEPRTDFVFAIIAEEFGLLGALFIIFLYMGLVIRGISISSHQKSMFNRIIGYGFSLNIFYNIIIHIGAVAGCLPTTGVTLPFISQGGSSMIVNSMAIGILLILGKQETV
ncbi:MAG: FtsW/RodA/SpoVE family cell cycle protein [Candidatus Cloacimonetes bacterium]|nr:FtsW/RodA/SpoVE family cell cycle protein [Candidatus Cloacimonadota bacterium]